MIDGLLEFGGLILTITLAILWMQSQHIDHNK